MTSIRLWSLDAVARAEMMGQCVRASRKRKDLLMGGGPTSLDIWTFVFKSDSSCSLSSTHLPPITSLYTNESPLNIAVRMEITYASSSCRDLRTISASSSSLGSSMPNRPVKTIPLQHPDTTSTSSSTPLAQAMFSRWTTKIKRTTPSQWIDTFLPCCRWIRTYKWREYLQPDLMAGLTVGVMLIPQSMSYAKLAGLHPIYGLYTGFIPIFVYAIFGSSRQLAIGPVALVSLLVSNVLGGIHLSDELYTELAILLAFMVGIMECIMALLRLGWLIRFISHSVISGFTTASAIVIALSQAKYFLGYDIVRSSKIVPLIKSIISGAHKFSWPPFVMGSCILAILLVMKHLGKSRKQFRFLRPAGPLSAVILGTVFVKNFSSILNFFGWRDTRGTSKLLYSKKL
ncbi:SULFATE TRANSPORTER 4.1-RELATED [Salix koriyanagi]|uniref:SULFATE TRANSPORTER 4.1-RELATED n=1 Tax=Salix koriyanagi TaxID=2511006 RepID=A0A9Q1AIV9_9ROSI|nr:SULFATE TRANSPORTER 4.1-RELATED [Salix koriyanagi]